ncbi:unnamed protein product [Kuraishia capsulata CBS 1993]|uniref:Chromatin modification-related protein EAF6 n=1 Tax=Kuraishia capsulata CBS 1993 TaxID=1382522 RepID=W6MKY4_9ASCO|nr:uncharacterized protein KUCA_T00003053001 [Kuraishia capsulata CBS 1993]CDK27076.1 unnamed protein product [Kuraishia capsulata CBS 1993]
MPEPTKVAEYEKLKKKLHQRIQDKRNLDKQLTQLEEEIFNKETLYLSEATYGNIIKGFDNFTKSASAQQAKKKMVFGDEDRIFSLSSSTYVRHLKKVNNGGSIDFEDLDDESPNGSPANRKRKAQD